LQWARPLVTPLELRELRHLVGRLVEAGESGNRQSFLERDFEFHRYCWRLCRNSFLTETIEKLMSPLFTFVVLAINSVNGKKRIMR